MFLRAPVSQFVQWDRVCGSQVFYLRTLCPHKICIYNRRGRGRRGGVWGVSAAELPLPQLPRPFSRSFSATQQFPNPRAGSFWGGGEGREPNP